DSLRQRCLGWLHLAHDGRDRSGKRIDNNEKHAGKLQLLLRDRFRIDFGETIARVSHSDLWGKVLSEYWCSPSRTSSPRWLYTVARVVTVPVSPCGESAIISSAGKSVSPACTSLRNLHDAPVNATKTSPMYWGNSVAPGAVKAKTCKLCTTGAIC